MSSTTSPLPLKSEPPLNDPPTDHLGAPTQAWSSWFIDASERLNKLGIGITDGSDAKPGHIGELLTTPGAAPVPLTSGVLATVTTLNLTAGDWDVTGYVTFHPLSGGPRSFYGVGLDALDVYFSTTFDNGTNNSGFTTATKRYNVTAATAVHVVAMAVFPSGALNVTGVARARRMR